MCWGFNHYGQASVPSGLTGVTAVSAGNLHTCALRDTGLVACWGYCTAGQIAVPSGLTGVTAGSAGAYHNCALRNDKAGSLKFESTVYEWLVVASARAQFKGTGQSNGVGNYGFLLTGIDGQVSGGDGVDRFRIKIWHVATGAVVYDNQMDAGETSNASTALSGGSIVIHR